MINFCPRCGSKAEYIVPEGDHNPRAVCTQCNHIEYENPRLIVGTLPVWQGKVLLCKRGIEPQHGMWTLPGGFMENAESTLEGALRETEEESHAPVSNLRLLSFLSLPFCNQVHAFYLADLDEPRWQTTPESTEIALFDEADVPWSQIAFRSVEWSLQHYFSCRKTGQFTLLDKTVTKPNW